MEKQMKQFKSTDEEQPRNIEQQTLQSSPRGQETANTDSSTVTDCEMTKELKSLSVDTGGADPSSSSSTKKKGRKKNRPVKPTHVECCEILVRPPPPRTGSGLMADGKLISCTCNATNCTLTSLNQICTCSHQNYLCSKSCPCTTSGTCDNFYHSFNHNRQLATSRYYYGIQLCPKKCSTCQDARNRQHPTIEISCSCTENGCTVGRQGRTCTCALESMKCSERCLCQNCRNR